MFVYVITNRVNGKQYVGQTIHSPEARFRRHCWPSTRTRMPITEAIRKYGRECFTLEVLATCSSQEELNRQEAYFAATLNTYSPNGYNLRAGNGFGAASEEFKERVRRGKLGIRPTEETRKRLSEAHLGQRWTEERRAQYSRRLQGVRPSEACRQASSERNAKTYELISPDGDRVTIRNMRQFCVANGLRASAMNNVVHGRARHHRGWRSTLEVEFVGSARRRPSRPAESYKVYTLRSPDGLLVVTRDLRSFSAERELGYTALLDVIAGRRRQHKGWRSAD